MLDLVFVLLNLSICIQVGTSQWLTAHSVWLSHYWRCCVVVMGQFIYSIYVRYVRSAETPAWNLLTGSAIIKRCVKCCMCQKLAFIHIMKYVIQFCGWVVTVCTIMFSKSFGKSYIEWRLLCWCSQKRCRVDIFLLSQWRSSDLLTFLLILMVGLWRTI